MKTTIELPDDLFAEVKAAAARRRTTMKAMIEHALRREILAEKEQVEPSKYFTINEYGMPVLRKTGRTPVTSEMVYELMEEMGI